MIAASFAQTKNTLESSDFFIQGLLWKMPGMIKTESASLSEISHSLLSLQSASSPAVSPGVQLSLNSFQDRWSGRQLKPEERGLYLIHLLYSCANAVASNNMEHTNFLLEQLSALASLTGDPMQRVATYFMEGLAARITRSWPGLYKALYSTRLSTPADLATARQILFNVCPYLKFGFLTVNQAILDAMQGEKVVHVVDLEVSGVSNVVQWQALLQAFSSRTEGPPHLRISAVNENKEVLSQMGQKLSETAERLDIPFQFHPVPVSPEALERDMLGVKIGEAVAVSSLMQLHRLLADEHTSKMCRGGNCEQNRKRKAFPISSAGSAFERVGSVLQERDEEASLWADKPMSKRNREAFENEVAKLHSKGGASPIDVKSENSRGSPGHGIGVLSLSHRHQKNGAKENACASSTIDRVLYLLRSLTPKVMVTVEQESNHNGGALSERFAKALHYYSAMFDSLDSTLPQHSGERITLERLIFGQEIRNIVACEGLERVERHEMLASWRRRFEQAGFSSAHLSPTTEAQAERLLSLYAPDGYKLQHDRGSLTLCWQNTPMFSVSAWGACP